MEFTGDPIVVSEGDLVDYVGPPPFTSDKIYDQTPPGVVMGLAWTSMGGNTLYVEAASMEQGENKGSLKTTGEEMLCRPSRHGHSCCAPNTSRSTRAPWRPQVKRCTASPPGIGILVVPPTHPVQQGLPEDRRFGMRNGPIRMPTPDLSKAFSSCPRQNALNKGSLRTTGEEIPCGPLQTRAFWSLEGCSCCAPTSPRQNPLNKGSLKTAGVRCHAGPSRQRHLIHLQGILSVPSPEATQQGLPQDHRCEMQCSPCRHRHCDLLKSILVVPLLDLLNKGYLMPTGVRCVAGPSRHTLSDLLKGILLVPPPEPIQQGLPQD